MKIEKVNTDKRRLLWLDALRVVSMFAVMVLHLSATGYKESDVGSFPWAVCYAYCMAVRFAVPVFVMISGAMFLDPQKEITPKNLRGKYIKRLAIAFLFWSTAYALLESLKEYSPMQPQYYVAVLTKAVTGHYHMWFIYMIVFLYILTPFLRKIAEDRQLLKMFAICSFLFGSCVEALQLVPYVGELVGSVAHDLGVGFFAGYAGYYCLGYYLYRYGLSGRNRTRLYLATAISLAVTVAWIAASVLLQRETEPFQSETLPHVFFGSCCIFLCFRKKEQSLQNIKWLQKLLPVLASVSFGMYLVHPAVNFILKKVGIHALTFTPVLCVPLCSLLVCGISFCIIYVMSKIPVLKKVI